MSKYIIMSDESDSLNDSIKSCGFSIIPTETINILPFESRHADIQCLKIDNTFFVLKDCVQLMEKLRRLGCNVISTEKTVSKDYPNNVLLNAVYLNGKLYGKLKSIDKAVINYCNQSRIEMINVNQGYTKCSTAIAGEYFITADRGIYNAVTRNGVEGLLIDSGDIKLDGVDYGFIGGCCFYNDGTFYCNGDITKHRNYGIITEFLNKKGLSINCLNKTELYDIGGFIVI